VLRWVSASGCQQNEADKVEAIGGGRRSGRCKFILSIPERAWVTASNVLGKLRWSTREETEGEKIKKKKNAIQD
jgi:hypothetical protein